MIPGRQSKKLFCSCSLKFTLNCRNHHLQLVLNNLCLAKIESFVGFCFYFIDFSAHKFSCSVGRWSRTLMQWFIFCC